jgi:hypothetical protein
MRSSTEEEFSLFLSQIKTNSVRVCGSSGKLTSFNFSGRVDRESTRKTFSIRRDGMLVFDLSGCEIEISTLPGNPRWILGLSEVDSITVEKSPE